ncbi:MULTISPECIES: ferritin-like domain-containing protein [Pontibacillus]|uniref:Ferritin family protein n=1 Tax=Pontibacillus chungwhensis TaxID=265426 RepID=A0ABY8V139_9BACI|nr:MULTISPECIES: ferritin family protein [Pontibacillus]MCD5322375.1 hypothetical protein [Pontibacillus sp. HN14]WIF99662.1 ferritin family protein [Pontibacillus chungwhensis]
MRFLLSRRFRIGLIVFSFIVFLASSLINAQTPPADYGAKGALKAPRITYEEALQYAIEDEYLAQERYKLVIQKYGQVFPFPKIQTAEKKHIEALERLYNQTDIEIPTNKAKDYVGMPSSIKVALQQAVQAEIDNIAMYNRFLEIKNLPPNAKKVFTNLRDASKKHLVAFNFGLSQQQ